MDNIFKYENWPYFFIAIMIFLIIINTRRCHEAGKFLTLAAKERAERKIAVVPVNNVAQVAAQISEQVAGQVATQISEQVAGQAAQQVAGQVAGQVANQVSEQTAAQVAARIAAQTTSEVLTETFSNKKKQQIPKTFKRVRILPNKEKFSTVKRVAQREKFQNIEPYNRSVEGVDIGAAGCSGGECKDCYKNLNDQINLGVNNYIFPNCNNDYMCMNGCNIQDQINNYQFDYRMGQSSTELERSRSGMYTSLNVDSCSQQCPSMGWMPEATTTRQAAADYINTLAIVESPVEDLKKK